MSRQQTRRTFLGTVATTASFAAIGQAGASAPGETDVTFTETFEASDRTWYVRSEHWTPGFTGSWDVSLTEPSSLDTPAVRYVADGRFSDGIAWIYTPISIESGTEFEGRISADAWSPAECELPYTRLHMYAGPTEPTSASVFPRAKQTDTPVSETGGLNKSLWGTAGWADYGFDWQTPAFDTDTLYLAVGVSTVAPFKFVHFLDSIDVDLRARSDEPELIWNGVSIETVDLSEVPEDSPAITTDPERGEVVVTGRMTVPTPCYDPTILNSYYNHDDDELRLFLDYSDTSSPDEFCTQQVVDKGYRAVGSFSGGLPGTVSMSEGGQTYSFDL